MKKWSETRRVVWIVAVVIGVEAEEEPPSPSGEEEPIFELEPNLPPQPSRGSEANRDGLFHSEEGCFDSIGDALLPRKRVASQEELPLLQLRVSHLTPKHICLRLRPHIYIYVYAYTIWIRERGERRIWEIEGSMGLYKLIKGRGEGFVTLFVGGFFIYYASTFILGAMFLFF